MKKKKILVISQGFWPEVFPINDIVVSLKKYGHKIDVLTGQPNYPDGEIFRGYKSYQIRKQIHSRGYNIFRVPIIKRGNGSFFRLIFNYLSFILSGIIFGSWILKKKKYDLILVYAPSPILQSIVGIYFKIIKKTKLITWVQDLWPDVLKETGYIKNKYILAIIKQIVTKIYICNNLIITQSKSFEKIIKPMAKGIKVRFCPNPAKRVYVKKKKLGIFTVTFAGNIGKVQAIETIINAGKIIGNNNKIKIKIVGSGKLLKWAKNDVKNKKISNIEFLGRVPSSKISKIFSDSSALIVSLKNAKVLNSTIPSKLQVYLSTSKPIIGSINGEAAEIIKNSKSGYVAKAENPKKLAETIKKMKTHSQKKLDILGSNGLNYYKKNYQINLILFRLNKIFDELFKNK